MNDLDKKLEELILSDVHDRGTWDVEGLDTDEVKAVVPKIKQAFTDAGYERKTDFMEGGGYLSLEESPVVQWLHDNGWRSGQEWYDRFVKELEKIALGTRDEEDGLFYFGRKQRTNDIWEAAKKAAGIE